MNVGPISQRLIESEGHDTKEDEDHKSFSYDDSYSKAIKAGKPAEYYYKKNRG